MKINLLKTVNLALAFVVMISAFAVRYHQYGNINEAGAKNILTTNIGAVDVMAQVTSKEIVDDTANNMKNVIEAPLMAAAEINDEKTKISFEYQGDYLEFSVELENETMLYWGDGNLEKVTTGKVTHKYGSSDDTYKVKIDGDEIYFLDLSGVKGIRNLSLNGCKSLEYLECDNTEIENLKLVDCENLKYLVCNNINIKNLDLTGSPELEYLYYGQGINSIRLNEECKTKLKLSGSSETTIEYGEKTQDLEKLPEFTLDSNDMTLDLGEEWEKYQVGCGVSGPRGWYNPLSKNENPNALIPVREDNKIYLEDVNIYNVAGGAAEYIYVRDKIKTFLGYATFEIPENSLEVKCSNAKIISYDREIMPTSNVSVFIQLEDGYTLAGFGELSNITESDIFIRQINKNEFQLNFKMPSGNVIIEVKTEVVNKLPEFTLNYDDMSIDLGEDYGKYEVSYSINTKPGLWYGIKEDFNNPYTIVTKGTKLMINELIQPDSISNVFIRLKDKPELGYQTIEIKVKKEEFPEFCLNLNDMSIDLGEYYEKYEFAVTRNEDWHRDSSQWDLEVNHWHYAADSNAVRDNKLYVSDIKVSNWDDEKGITIREKENKNRGEAKVLVPKYNIAIEGPNGLGEIHAFVPLQQVEFWYPLEEVGGNKVEIVSATNINKDDIAVKEYDEGAILSFKMPYNNVHIKININRLAIENEGFLTAYDSVTENIVIGGRKYALAKEYTLTLNGTSRDDKNNSWTLDSALEALEIKENLNEIKKRIKALIVLNDDIKVERIELRASAYIPIISDEVLVTKLKETPTRYVINTNKGKITWSVEDEKNKNVKFPVVYINGVEADIRDIMPGMVISVYGTDLDDDLILNNNDDLKKIDIRAVKDGIVSGQVERINKSDYTITIAGRTYILSNENVTVSTEELSDYGEAQKLVVNELNSILDSDSVTLYLNAFGEYAFVILNEVFDVKYGIVDEINCIRDDCYINLIMCEGNKIYDKIDKTAFSQIKPTDFIEYFSKDIGISRASKLIDVKGFVNSINDNEVASKISSGEETELVVDASIATKFDFLVRKISERANGRKTIKYHDESSLNGVSLDEKVIVYGVNENGIKEISLDYLNKLLDENEEIYVVPFANSKATGYGTAEVQANVLVVVGYEENDDPQEEPVKIRKFIDVKEDDWYYNIVTTTDYLEGTTSKTFSPDDPLTREMFIAALYNVSENPEALGTSDFPDVYEGSWSEDAIIWATENSLVSGYLDGRFKPSEDITRQEAIVVLNKYAKYAGASTDNKVDLSKFADASEVYDWAVEAMSWAVAEGIISGNNYNELSATEELTRAQMTSIFSNLIKALK